jgi:hypothetical protein
MDDNIGFTCVICEVLTGGIPYQINGDDFCSCCSGYMALIQSKNTNLSHEEVKILTRKRVKRNKSGLLGWRRI